MICEVAIWYRAVLAGGGVQRCAVSLKVNVVVMTGT
jgi:hypothetical protein